MIIRNAAASRVDASGETQTVRPRNMQPNDNRKSMANANTLLLRTIGKLLKRPGGVSDSEAASVLSGAA